MEKQRQSPHRIIMRIDVAPETPRKLNRTVEEFGSTNISVTSRTLDWFIKQEEEVKAVILGLMPAGHEIDVKRRLLKRLLRTYNQK